MYLIGLAVLIGVWVVYAYNGLVKLRVLAENAWADIDVQLKRRHDLIPNLVDVVRGHADFERGTLEEVVDARSRALDAEGPTWCPASSVSLKSGVVVAGRSPTGRSSHPSPRSTRAALGTEPS